MIPLEQNLTQYAAYHRDRRNVATHFVGVPMIVFSAVLAMATVSLNVGSIAVTLSAVACIAACAYYLRLDLGFGIAMALILFAMCAASSEIAPRFGLAGTLGLAALLFAAGWALQFLGHRFEGMKPAFFDDAKQLLIGPLFVLAEIAFAIGARPELRRYVEQRVGPTVARREHRPANT